MDSDETHGQDRPERQRLKPVRPTNPRSTPSEGRVRGGEQGEEREDDQDSTQVPPRIFHAEPHEPHEREKAGLESHQHQQEIENEKNGSRTHRETDNLEEGGEKKRYADGENRPGDGCAL